MSVICPMCKKSVNKFKSNSHVIPRWMILETKTGGRNVKITWDNEDPIVKEKNQEDIKGDFICPECEILTSKLDGYGAKFFKSLKKVPLAEKKQYKNDLFHFTVDYEGSEVWDFIVSIFLRNHYLKEKNSKINLLGKHEKGLSSLLFKNNDLKFEKYPIYLYYHPPSCPIAYPSSFKYEARRVWSFCGYNFQCHLELSSHLPPTQRGLFIQKSKINLIEFPFSKTNMAQNLFEAKRKSLIKK